MRAAISVHPRDLAMSSPAVTVTAVRRIPVERARAFEVEMRKFFTFAAAQPGCVGLQLLERDLGAEVDYMVVAGFASLVDRQRFVGHRDYKTWMRALDAHASRPAEVEEHAGLRLLFANDPQRPPTWKIAAVTWLGVCLVTTPLIPFMPRIETWIPFPWSNLLFNGLVVALLTWAVMPALTRLLARWLGRRSDPPE